jgi:hypothetical protein
VRKYDGSGTEQWTRQFGTTGTDQANGVAVDAAGVYVVGQTNGALQAGQGNAGGNDAFVRKYDTNGNEQWTRQFGSALDDFALGAAADATGIYVGGTTNGALLGQTSAGNQDAYWRRYDASGNEVATSQFGSSSFEQGNAVAADATGVYLAGATVGALPGQTTAGSADAYVAKLPTTGAQTVTYSDNSFQNSDWELTVFLTQPTAGSSTATQETSGGNPGSFRRVNITVNGQGQSMNVWGFHRKLASTYDPKVRGAIGLRCWKPGNSSARKLDDPGTFRAARRAVR